MSPNIVADSDFVGATVRSTRALRGPPGGGRNALSARLSGVSVRLSGESGRPAPIPDHGPLC